MTSPDAASRPFLRPEPLHKWVCCLRDVNSNLELAGTFRVVQGTTPENAAERYVLSSTDEHVKKAGAYLHVLRWDTRKTLTVQPAKGYTVKEEVARGGPDA